jgi:hypothetical protein
MEQRTFFQRLRHPYTVVYVDSQRPPRQRQRVVIGMPRIALELSFILAATILMIAHLPV